MAHPSAKDDATLVSYGVTQTVYGLDSFWPWEVFESGAVEKDVKGSYVRADWPWWRIGRKLRLTLDPKEQEEVQAVINRHYRTKVSVNPIEDQFPVENK